MNTCVSVIMPSYNCAPWLAAAIDSALAQQQDGLTVELLVVDDGSTDDTASVLARYADRVRVLKGPHRGVSAARNLAIRQATGSLIAFLDADDIWPAGKLATQVQVLAQRPQVVLCHTACTMFGQQEGDGPIVEERRRKIDGDCFIAQYYQTGIMPSSVLVRRADLPSHGFYEDMPVAEDYALFLRMLWGREAAYLPGIQTMIRRRPGQATADQGKRLQTYNSLARLRVLDDLGQQVPTDQAASLRSWVLEEMWTCAYSRYWQGDYALAHRAFGWLHRYGRSPSWKHRLRAWAGAWLDKDHSENTL